MVKEFYTHFFLALLGLEMEDGETISDTLTDPGSTILSSSPLDWVGLCLSVSLSLLGSPKLSILTAL